MNLAASSASQFCKPMQNTIPSNTRLSFFPGKMFNAGPMDANARRNNSNMSTNSCPVLQESICHGRTEWSLILPPPQFEDHIFKINGLSVAQTWWQEPRQPRRQKQWQTGNGSGNLQGNMEKEKPTKAKVMATLVTKMLAKTWRGQKAQETNSMAKFRPQIKARGNTNVNERATLHFGQKQCQHKGAKQWQKLWHILKTGLASTTFGKAHFMATWYCMQPLVSTSGFWDCTVPVFFKIT